MVDCYVLGKVFPSSSVGEVIGFPSNGGKARYTGRYSGGRKGGFPLSSSSDGIRGSQTGIGLSVVLSASKRRPTSVTAYFEGSLFVAAFLLYISEFPSTDFATLPVVVPGMAGKALDLTTVLDISPVGFPWYAGT